LVSLVEVARSVAGEGEGGSYLVEGVHLIEHVHGEVDGGAGL